MAEFRNNDFDSFCNFQKFETLGFFTIFHFGSSRLDKTVGHKISFQNRQKLGFTYRSRNQCPPTVYYEKKSQFMSYLNENDSFQR